MCHVKYLLHVKNLICIISDTASHVGEDVVEEIRTFQQHMLLKVKYWNHCLMLKLDLETS